MSLWQSASKMIPVIFTFCIQSLPTSNQDWSVWPVERCGSDSVTSKTVSFRPFMTSTLFSWIRFSVGNRLLHCEDTQAALWRGSRGEELRLPANIQQQHASHKSEFNWKGTLQPPSNLWVIPAPAQGHEIPRARTIQLSHFCRSFFPLITYVGS